MKITNITALAALLLTVVLSRTSLAAELSAEVRGAEPVTLSTNLAAQVVSAAVSPGQRVAKGELLVQLDDGVSRARLPQARAELAHQKLKLAEAEAELQRSEELYDRTLLSDHDLDLARIAHAAADSSYQRAHAELRLVQHALGLNRIVAPFDALVLERHVQAGETLNGQLQSVPLYTLVVPQLRRLSLVLEPAQAASLTLNEKVEIEVGEQRYTGQVAAISRHRGKEAELLVDVIFTPPQDEVVRVGEMARVRLP